MVFWAKPAKRKHFRSKEKRQAMKKHRILRHSNAMISSLPVYKAAIRRHAEPQCPTVSQSFASPPEQ